MGLPFETPREFEGKRVRMRLRGCGGLPLVYQLLETAAFASQGVKEGSPVLYADGNSFVGIELTRSAEWLYQPYSLPAAGMA